MPLEKVPAKARPLVEKFANIVASHGVPAAHAALCFALQYSRAPFMVTGAETVTQLEEQLDAEKRQKQLKACSDELARGFKDMDGAIVNPSLWSRIQK